MARRSDERHSRISIVRYIGPRSDRIRSPSRVLDPVRAPQVVNIFYIHTVQRPLTGHWILTFFTDPTDFSATSQSLSARLIENRRDRLRWPEICTAIRWTIPKLSSDAGPNLNRGSNPPLAVVTARVCRIPGGTGFGMCSRSTLRRKYTFGGLTMKFDSLKTFCPWVFSTVLAVTLLPVAAATAATVTATMDTFITEHTGFGGTTSTHSSLDLLYLVRGTGGYRTFPMVQFDLSSFAGETVAGGTVGLELQLVKSYFGLAGVQSVSVREVLVAWDGSTSWANFGGIGFDETIGVHTGANLETMTVAWTGAESSVIFTLPASVVTNWIADPSSNHGLILISNTATDQTDLGFAAIENPDYEAARLHFTVVPLPAALPLLGSALIAFLGTAGRRRRRIWRRSRA